MFSFFNRHKDPVKLPYHTDIHCHIMPDVDHGATDTEDALAMIKAEMDMGISSIILTPHMTKGSFENTPESLKHGFQLIQNRVNDENIDIQLQYSAEYRIDDYFHSLHAQKKIVPMPNNYLMIEGPHLQEIMELDQLIFDLRVEGYNLIMAHPERYPYYWHRHDRYTALHNAGLLFQINLLSLAGYHGEGAKANAHWLIENDLADLFGSDMHCIDHADIIAKYLTSRDWRKIEKKVLPNLKNDTLFI